VGILRELLLRNIMLSTNYFNHVGENLEGKLYLSNSYYEDKIAAANIPVSGPMTISGSRINGHCQLQAKTTSDF
jgi:hypothetical protein